MPRVGQATRPSQRKAQGHCGLDSKTHAMFHAIRSCHKVPLRNGARQPKGLGPDGSRRRANHESRALLGTRNTSRHRPLKPRTRERPVFATMAPACAIAATARRFSVTSGAWQRYACSALLNQRSKMIIRPPPQVDQTQRISVRHRANIGRCGVNVQRIVAVCGVMWGRLWAKVGRTWAKVGRTWAEVGRTWATLVELGPNFHEIGPTSAEIGRIRSKSAQCWPIAAKLADVGRRAQRILSIDKSTDMWYIVFDDKPARHRSRVPSDKRGPEQAA